jgi:hypothetical protein
MTQHQTPAEMAEEIKQLADSLADAEYSSQVVRRIIRQSLHAEVDRLRVMAESAQANNERKAHVEQVRPQVDAMDGRQPVEGNSDRGVSGVRADRHDLGVDLTDRAALLKQVIAPAQRLRLDAAYLVKCAQHGGEMNQERVVRIITDKCDEIVDAARSLDGKPDARRVEPEAMEPADWHETEEMQREDRTYCRGWNDCRAAMLAAAPEEPEAPKTVRFGFGMNMPEYHPRHMWETSRAPKEKE